MGFAARVASAFPGNREEANRAGMTPRILVRTIDFSTVRRAEGVKKQDPGQQGLTMYQIAKRPQSGTECKPLLAIRNGTNTLRRIPISASYWIESKARAN